MGQSIRPSQYITTYGPGSILEGERGPRVILSLQGSGIFSNGREPRSFEIYDQRFCDSLLDGHRIVRIPSNAEIGLPDSTDAYETRDFPIWSLCVEHNTIYRYDRQTHTACPLCSRPANQFEAWQKSRREAIRFIMACKNGHMDDVNWIGLVRHASANCMPAYMLWEGGGSLSDVTIRCPLCREKTNLGQAYGREYRCTGRFPEKNLYGLECNAGAKMVQRGAANLRMPEILTSLTIPPRSRELHELLGRQDVKAALYGRNLATKDEIMRLLEAFAQNRLIPHGVVYRIGQYDENLILKALGDVSAQDVPKTMYEYRVDELDALQKAATLGEPVQPSSTPGAPPRFEVHRNEVCFFKTPSGRILRVTPVCRLRVVAVQKGYRRIEPVTSPVVGTEFEDNGHKWYPGVELHGEGVFIDLKPEGDSYSTVHWKMNGIENEKWMEAYTNPDLYGYQDKLSDYSCLHPVFVWWHTLAHRLINALSVDSGYSSAAIRERVYIKLTGDGITGGILLYTAQPGGDGTLGGLIATVPKFDRVLNTALRDIYICSNDPLCSGNEFNPGAYNGAACYACQLISETSCEHRNMFIDRNLLKENLP